MPKIKKLPGIKQLRGIKDKAVIKIVTELESGRQEKQAVVDTLARTRDSLQGAISGMIELIAEFGGTDDYDEMLKQLKDGNAEYDKHLAQLQNAQKQLKAAEKKLERYEKAQEVLLKLASRDAALQAMLN